MQPAPLSAPPDIRAFVHTSQGRRPYQQDRHAHCGRAESVLAHDSRIPVIAAVFDGHGPEDTGHLTAELCSQKFVTHLRKHPMWNGFHAKAAELNPIERARKALADTVADMESLALKDSASSKHYSGCTLCAAVVISTEMDQSSSAPAAIVTANVGDSRTIAGTGTWGSSVKAIDLTVDHKPSHPTERERIECAGGWIVNDMLNGYIGMSRAIGDNDLKEHRNITKFDVFREDMPRKEKFSFGSDLLIAAPEIDVRFVDDQTHFAIVASDGIWHVLSSQTAVDYVHGVLLSGNSQNPAESLVKFALKRGAQDNLTAFVLLLSKQTLKAAAPGALVESKRSSSKWRAGVSRQMSWRARTNTNLSDIAAFHAVGQVRTTESSSNDSSSINNINPSLLSADDGAGPRRTVHDGHSRRIQSNLERVIPPLNGVSHLASSGAERQNRPEQVPSHPFIDNKLPKATTAGDSQVHKRLTKISVFSRARDEDQGGSKLRGMFARRRRSRQQKVYDDETLHGANNYPGDLS